MQTLLQNSVVNAAILPHLSDTWLSNGTRSAICEKQFQPLPSSSTCEIIFQVLEQLSKVSN